jgi:hypothetical protein
MPHRQWELIGFLVFGVAVAGVVYGIAEQQRTYGNEAAAIALIAGLGAMQLITAFLIGRWWALLLPLLAVLIAVPAGYPNARQGEDPPPIWVGFLVVAPAAIVIAALGLVLRRIIWRRARPG